MSTIEFRNITKKYGDNLVLNNINLTIEDGKLITLLGPSGCGKSTLLRCLAGLETVTSGQIILNGVDITDMDPKDREIGMVFQQYSLFPNMNVYNNIAFGLRMKKVSEIEIKEKVSKAIDMVALTGREKAMPNELSGGMQQRVALARSIVTEPKVLLLDEPLSAIDAKLRKSLQNEIRRIQQEMNITTIFVTHDQDEAMIMSDIINLFNKGNVEQSGTPMEIYTNPSTPFAASFIGNYNILSKKSFESIMQVKIDNAEQVAIRPETVELSNEFIPVEEAYQFEAVVKRSSNRGNVIRYTLINGDEEIKADALFRSKALFNVGDTVFVTIFKRNCLVF